MSNTRAHFSQHGEDLEVIKRLAGKRSGYFVEVGALNGTSFSNTYLLEREYDWTGLLVEADPAQADRCRTARPGSHTLAKAATSPENAGSTLPLTVVQGAEEFSSMSLANRSRRFINAKRESGAKISSRTVEVEAQTIEEMLHQVAAPEDIDFLSIDIEGYELHALRGVDFTKRTFRIVLIENNQLLPNRRILVLLAKAGYGYIRAIGLINYWYEPMPRHRVFIGIVKAHADAAIAIAIRRRRAWRRRRRGSETTRGA